MRNASPIKSPKPARVKKTSGVQRADSSRRDLFDSWLAHHKESSLDALRRLYRTPFSTLLTMLVLALALALPAGLSILVQNVQAATGDWDGRARLSVFLQQNVSASSQQALASQWRKHGNVADIDIITPEQALNEFKAQGGTHDVLAALPDNPLPPVLVIYPQQADPLALEQLEKALLQNSQVDKVVFDMAWIQKLNAFIELLQRLVFVLTLALAAGVILVVNNTLQLAIDNRRDEIVVMKTVGGTDGFVRRPFLYTGFWYGFGSGLLALVLILVAFGFVSAPAKELMQLYGNAHGVTGMSFRAFVFLPLLAGGLGLAGAIVAVRRHLHDIEPRQF